MGFWGVVIANNLIEIVAGICVLIVMGLGFTILGRKLERTRLRRMGPGEWQAYLANPKRWLRAKEVGRPL